MNEHEPAELTLSAIARAEDCKGSISTIGRAGRRRPTIGLRFFADLRRSAGAFAELWLVWHERARQRRDLARLDDHMLKDIGVSRADAEAETAKSFWQP